MVCCQEGTDLKPWTAPRNALLISQRSQHSFAAQPAPPRHHRGARPSAGLHGVSTASGFLHAPRGSSLPLHGPHPGPGPGPTPLSHPGPPSGGLGAMWCWASRACVDSWMERLREPHPLPGHSPDSLAAARVPSHHPGRMGLPRRGGVSRAWGHAELSQRRPHSV